jgi:hypothetical protein
MHDLLNREELDREIEASLPSAAEMALVDELVVFGWVSDLWRRARTAERNQFDLWSVYTSAKQAIWALEGKLKDGEDFEIRSPGGDRLRLAGDLLPRLRETTEGQQRLAHLIRELRAIRAYAAAERKERRAASERAIAVGERVLNAFAQRQNRNVFAQQQNRRMPSGWRGASRERRPRPAARRSRVALSRGDPDEPAPPLGRLSPTGALA